MKRTMTNRLLVAAGLAASALTMTSAAQAQQAYPAGDPKVRPNDDNFYAAPSSSELAGMAPGTVLRYRPVPASSLSTNTKEAWQLMYRSNNGKDQPVAMVTTLYVPKNAPETGKKLLSYQPAYDALNLNCAPSGQATANNSYEKAFFGAALSKGIYVVTSDYEGLDSEWIAGKNTAHGVLDGIRAVESFSKSGLNADTPIGLAGYSGGGFATMWAAEQSSVYAPELKIMGAAAGGLPVNPINVAKKVDGTLWAGAYIGAVVGLSRAYPEIDVTKYANDAGLAALKDAGTRCLAGIATGNPELLTAYAYKKGSMYYKDPNFLDLPEMQAINRENTMGQVMPTMPVYIFEGTVDELMPIADADNLVKSYCAAKVNVQYKRMGGTGHVLGIVELGNGINYVLDRLNGKPVTSNCQ